MFKVSRGLRHRIASELFQFREQIPYKLRQWLLFHIPNFSCAESLKFLGPKIWPPMPNEMKHLENLGNLDM